MTTVSRRALHLRLSIIWIIALFAGTIASGSRPLQAASFDAIADGVLGQTGFSSKTPGTGPTGLRSPWGIAIDQNSGRLYVADSDSNRVLSWPSAASFTNGQAADLVIGQPDFNSVQANRGSVTPSATSLALPIYVAVDSSGNLFVSDTNNNRVLAYTAPITTGMAASLVFGQPDFMTHNNPGTGASGFALPAGVVVDSDGNLYVADYYNNRVLEFDTALTSDTTADRIFNQRDPNIIFQVPGADTLQHPMGLAVDTRSNLYVTDTGYHRVLQYDTPLLTDTIADRVFGQPHFAASAPNNGGISASSLDEPQSIAVDSSGNLYIADGPNSRVLEYDTPLISDTTADRVFGQPNFTANTYNNDGINDHSLAGPRGVAVDEQGNLYIADTSNNRLLKYEQPVADPTPIIASLSQSEVLAGSAGFTLTITGTNFISATVMRWNGADRPTTFINSTQLTTEISAADLETAGSASIIVFNPAPGGGASNAQIFTIRPKFFVYLPLVAN